MDVTKEITDKDGKKKTVKVQTPKIDLILNSIRQRGMFTSMTRFQYLDYDIDEALQIVEAIGKSRNQRFVIDGENRFTYENFIRWCHCDTAMRCLDPNSLQVIPGNLKRGIYIAGNTGTGKSWCLEIMQAYCRVFGFKVQFFEENDPSFLAWGNVRADAICDTFTESGNISGYKKRYILGIQDFGSEPQESLYMGNRVEVMRSLVEYRGDKTDSLTLITSNLKLGGEKLLNRYGDRVASRLTEMCNYFEIRGADRRKWRNIVPNATKTDGTSKAPNR